MVTTINSNKNPLPPLWQRRLYLPAYSIKESAYYANANYGTVNHWHYYGGKVGPAIPGKEKNKPMSYFELIEVAFVATMRQENISLQKIRKAREYACKTFNVEYPFAQLKWQTEGTHLLLDLRHIMGNTDLERLIVANKAGQEAWKPIMAERFKQFEYQKELALTWYVRGKGNPIVIDPRISFGAPTVQGLPTWVIRGRFVAGETVPEIKADFNIDINNIVHALKFEGVEPPAEYAS